jgi:hypothetical protein
MGNQTNSNGRDEGKTFVESLLTGAGVSIGHVLDDRQVHAVNLAIEVFAYLLAALPAQKAELTDVIRMLKFYARGLNSAKGE